MRIPLTEPIAPRYITINKETNQVHLMVPVVGGEEISTDNTCQSTVALRDFFNGGALHELTAYKEALAFDIELLEVGKQERVAKEARLAQIEAYILAVSAMRQNYGEAMNALITRPSNLYGIQLRPRNQDSYSRVVNPAFNINRRNDAGGSPLSALYNAMHRTFPTTKITVQDPRTRLTEAVLAHLSASPIFTDIQRVLTEQCLQLFGVNVDFTQQTDSTPCNQTVIDEVMAFDEDSPATPKEYVEALLDACARDLWENMPTPPFYSIPDSTAEAIRTERLSILTQFFLSIVNIYCKARGISTHNFGTILDASEALSNDLVSVVASALSAKDDVERQVCTFCNEHALDFGLSRPLSADDVTAIIQKFARTYRTVTATNENPHMDDFMILDCDATGETAKFVTHQGSICTNFAEIVDAALPNQDYFSLVRADFAGHPAEMPHKNEWVAGTIDIEPEALLERITDEQFEKLPETVKVACRAHLIFQKRQFLPGVAKGRQDEIDALLTASPANKQDLLRTPGVFTDYSGRTFNCTAYEYAYWAKDTQMCRMLERHMDDETKAQVLARIDEIERIDAATDQPVGLGYSQRDTEHRSAHFDLSRLISALQRYVDGSDNWYGTKNWAAIKAAWMEVGIAQRDLPVHVVNEYCRPDRSFNPRPAFNEANLPRRVSFINDRTSMDAELFPLAISDSSGLGIDFALTRGETAGVWAHERGGWLEGVMDDLAAVSHLNEIRTVDLVRSRENLLSTEPEPGPEPGQSMGV